MNFEIQYLGRGKNDKHWFLAKEEYLVCLSSSERSCDCMWGTMQESRGKKSECKHVFAAKNLLNIMKGHTKKVK